MANDTQQRGGQQQRRNHYSNADYSSFDSHFTALKYRFMNSMGIIEFAFIDPSFVGKEGKDIKKGDKVYDHESTATFYLTPANAVVIKRGLHSFREALEAQEEDAVDQLRSVRFPFHATGGKEKVLTIFAPGTVKVSANTATKKIAVDTSDKFLLQIEAFDKEGEPVRACHVMQTSDVQYAFTKASESEGAEELIHHDMELLEAFLDNLIMLGSGALRQGVLQGLPAGGGTTASGGQSRRNAPTPSFDDEDEGDDDVGNSSPAKAGGKGKTATKLKLEEEFDDDVPM